MKTIGVLGGVGPQATMDFEARLHRESQRQFPRQTGNSGYPPLAVFYHRQPPVLFDDTGDPLLPYQAHPDLLDGARWLGQMADFLVIAGNGAHRVAAQVEAAAGIPLLNMVDLVLDEVARRDWRRVGVLAYGEPVVYLGPLEAQGREVETIGSPLRDLLNQAIQRLMAGHTSAEETAAAYQAVEELRMRGVDGIIAGCTEIPLLLGEGMNAPDLINPVQLLAETAVTAAFA